MTGPNVAACAEELPAPLPDVEKVRLIAGPALQEIWSMMGERRVMQETLFYGFSLPGGVGSRKSANIRASLGEIWRIPVRLP